MTFAPTPRQLLLFSALFSAAALGVALAGQYGFSLHPCDLCVYQRVPYGFIIAFGLIGFFAVKTPRLLVMVAWLCAALFLTDALIAGYHTGVEQGWFKGPTACSSNAAGEQTLEEMRAAILHAPLVSCEQEMTHILGLSMAAWNFLAASSAFFLLAYYLIRKPHAAR